MSVSFLEVAKFREFPVNPKPRALKKQKNINPKPETPKPLNPKP